MFCDFIKCESDTQIRKDLCSRKEAFICLGGGRIGRAKRDRTNGLCGYVDVAKALS